MSGEAFVVCGAGHAPIKHRFPPSVSVQVPVHSVGPEEWRWAAGTSSSGTGITEELWSISCSGQSQLSLGPHPAELGKFPRMELLPAPHGALSAGCAALRGTLFSPEVASELPLLQLVPVAPSPFAVQSGDAVHGCPKQVPCCTGLLHPWVGFYRVGVLQSGPVLPEASCSTQSSCQGPGKLSVPNWKITPRSPGAALGANLQPGWVRMVLRATGDRGHQPLCTSLP